MSSPSHRPVPRTLTFTALGAGLVLALAAPDTAAAQPCTGRGECEVPPLAAGDLVRIRSTDGGGTYRIVGVSVAGDTIVARRHRRPEIERFAIASIERLERSVGLKSRLGGLGRGLLYGGLTGVVVGGAVGYADGDDEAGFFALTAGEKAGVGAVLAGTTLGLVGGAIGATFPGRRWVSIPVDDRLTLRPMHGGLGVRIAF